MSRFATAQESPPQPTVEGDQQFIGLNMKLDRGMLAPGYYTGGNNKRVSNGVATKRFGSFCPLFANVVPFSEIIGSGIYSNPRGSRMLLIATSTKVYQITSGGYPTAIALPAGVTLFAPVYFTQVFDKVRLSRGTAVTSSALVWDGTATGTFERVTKKEPLDTNTVIFPNVERGVEFKGRFIGVKDQTEVVVSDILDMSSTDPVFADFFANLGTSDAIVRLYTYVRSGLVVAKENRIELLSGFTDPLHPETAQLEELNTTVGTCAWDSWAMVGGDLFFLSEPGGVYSISQVLQDRLQTNPVAVSDPIEPLIKRINWNYAGAAVAAVHGFYYYLAVPLDGSTYNNAILVYNTVTKQWEGYDTWNEGVGMRIDNLLLFDYHGARRLFAINHGTKSVHLLYEGKFDDKADGTRFQIADRFETRGYATLGWNAATRRDFRRTEVGIGTWWPHLSVSQLSDRANDSRSLTPAPVTKNRKKWIHWGQVDRVLNNVNADHERPNLEDYSVDFSEAEPIYIDPEGIDYDKTQNSVLRFSTRTRGSYVSLRIESTQGDCDVRNVVLESAGVQRDANRRAA